MAATQGDLRWPTLAESDATWSIRQHGSTYRPIDASYWDVETRLDWMTRMGIASQVVSPLPVLLTYWAPTAPARGFVRAQNHAIAALVAQAPQRLEGFGTVTLQDTEAALRDLDEICDLGLSGVEIGTRAGDRELDHPDVLPFFAEVARRRVPLLLHAQEAEGLGRMDDPLVRFGLGVPTDAGIAATVLCLSAIVETLPDLRLCICHGGGTFFWALPRLRPLVRQSRGADAEERLLAAADAIYVDSASLGPENLDYLLAVHPADRVLLGSDFPATQTRSPLSAWAEPRFASIRDKVLTSNALAFLQGDPMSSIRRLGVREEQR